MMDVARGGEWTDEYVRFYQRHMYGATHMQEYLRLRSETLAALIRECSGPCDRALRILEVACGPGLSLKFLSRSAAKHWLVGMDRAPEMIRLASENTANESARLRLSYGSVFELPFRDAAFDVVYGTRFIHMFPDKAPVFRELRRVVKPEGLIIIEFYNRPYHLARYVAQRQTTPLREYLYHFPSSSEVRSLIGRAAQIIPLRFGGERVLRSMVGDGVTRRLLRGAWRSPLRPFVDEYFAVIRPKDLSAS